ncbi:UNKNOWN [Stylonychia lemnae]|uniref:Uncharacterized protein n=1 Tax=Stylonychia lemnae TaxID=5949 RepID=A0A078B581_STYLE|nr:UNKNOWN [Stylonychia lemnae]|eukprot:CDW89584.1 UNKNOWN [Stylonychia lemnae]
MKACIIILAITLTSAVNALSIDDYIYKQQEQLIVKQNLKKQKDRDGLIAKKLKPQQTIPPSYLNYQIGACGMIDPPPHCGEAQTTADDNTIWLRSGSAWVPMKFNTPQVQAIEEFNSYQLSCELQGNCRSYGFGPKKSPYLDPNYWLHLKY